MTKKLMLIICLGIFLGLSSVNFVLAQDEPVEVYYGDVLGANQNADVSSKYGEISVNELNPNEVKYYEGATHRLIIKDSNAQLNIKGNIIDGIDANEPNAIYMKDGNIVSINGVTGALKKNYIFGGAEIEVPPATYFSYDARTNELHSGKGVKLVKQIPYKKSGDENIYSSPINFRNNEGGFLPNGQEFKGNVHLNEKQEIRILKGKSCEFNGAKITPSSSQGCTMDFSKIGKEDKYHEEDLVYMTSFGMSIDPGSLSLKGTKIEIMGGSPYGGNKYTDLLMKAMTMTIYPGKDSKGDFVAIYNRENRGLLPRIDMGKNAKAKIDFEPLVYGDEKFGSIEFTGEHVYTSFEGDPRYLTSRPLTELEITTPALTERGDSFILKKEGILFMPDGEEKNEALKMEKEIFFAPIEEEIDTDFEDSIDEASDSVVASTGGFPMSLSALNVLFVGRTDEVKKLAKENDPRTFAGTVKNIINLPPNTKYADDPARKRIMEEQAVKVLLERAAEDKDGNGYIDGYELKDIIDRMENELSKPEYENLFFEPTNGFNIFRGVTAEFREYGTFKKD